MTCLVIGLSYGAFIFSTDKYRSSELLISKLNYSIDIQEDGSSKSTINGSSVTVPANTKVYLNITLTSVNEIDSKYTLAYKTSTNAKVQYSDRTPWNTQGIIKGIDSNTYSKKIRVVIDNTDISTSSTVNFQVYGGYSFNSYANIELTDGYVSVSGPYTEVTTNIGNRLVDIIESDTSCLTSTSNTCLYGGENIKNYVQYPEDEDKTKNLWRIIGSYQIDDQTLPKLISQSTTSTSTSTLTTDLTSFYNTLEDNDVLVQETNKFNCFTSTCAESTYTNIGLLTDYEYNQIGGVNSYLTSNENYYINTSTAIKEVTSSGITNPSSTSGLKPTIYLQTGVQVTGSGTASDPYIINPASDINLVSYTLNGQATDKTYAELLKTNVVKNVTCKNGTVAKWDNATSSINLSSIKTPDYCTIDFGDGYSVSLTATNGTVTPPATISVGYGGSVTFNVSQNTGYSTTLTTNTCGGTLSSDGKTYTVSNVTGDKTCSIDFKKLDYQIAVSVSGGSSSPTSQKIEYNSSYEFTITPSTGYTLAGGTATCNGGATANLNTSTGKLTVSKVANAQTCSVTLQKQKYNVTLTVVNGSGGGTQSVSHGSNAVYTVTPSTGYKLELETNTCGGTLSGSTYTISNITSGKTCSISFKSTPTLHAKLLADKTTRPNRGSFSSVLTTDNTKTLYTGTENRTTVYYFAGNATDNWVKFGKNASNQDLYWRIIRTNSDGSVRLLYHGTSTTAENAYIGESAFNSRYNDIAYVSYMYGSLGSIPNARTNQKNSSTIKTYIDNWYTRNLEAKGYTKYLSTTAVYCNDRSRSDNTYFGAYTRLGANKTPSYDCAATEDKFTADTSTGNGKLDHPIALMTADEVSFAGGLYETNAPTWYYYNSSKGSSTGSTWWWLLSPGSWSGSDAYVFVVIGSSSYPGYLGGGSSSVSGANGVRPVISLKSCVKTSGGDGSANAPYTIEETTSGC